MVKTKPEKSRSPSQSNGGGEVAGPSFLIPARTRRSVSTLARKDANKKNKKASKVKQEQAKLKVKVHRDKFRIVKKKSKKGVKKVVVKASVEHVLVDKDVDNSNPEDEGEEEAPAILKRSIAEMIARTSNVDEHVVVPWASRNEWHDVGKSIHEGDVESAIREITCWQMRVPELPVAVDTTLMVLKALTFDEGNKDNVDLLSEFAIQSMLGTSLVRFCHLIGQIAGAATGSNSIEHIKDFANLVEVPDWMFTFRNEYNHGIKIPSCEALRLCGEVMITWLKEHYWKTAEEIKAEKDSRLEKIVDLVTAFSAAKIYEFRSVQFIKDKEITRYIENCPRKIKTPVALKKLLSLIKGHFQKNREETLNGIAVALIPDAATYEKFKGVMQSCCGARPEDASDKSLMFTFWSGFFYPVIKFVFNSNKIIELCLEILQLRTDSNHELISRWIVKCLAWIDLEDEEPCSQHFLTLVTKVFETQSPGVKYMFGSCRPILEEQFGFEEEKLQKLDKLALVYENPANAHLIPEWHSGLFTVADLIALVEEVEVPPAEEDDPDAGVLSVTEYRDEQNGYYWRAIQVASILDINK